MTTEHDDTMRAERYLQERQNRPPIRDESLYDAPMPGQLRTHTPEAMQITKELHALAYYLAEVLTNTSPERLTLLAKDIRQLANRIQHRQQL